jgi:hypothetical protein
MATHLYLTANREMWGMESSHDFQLHKTPTKVTGKCMANNAKDALTIYTAWCQNFVKDSEQHLNDLKKWLHEQHSFGYEVKWYVV